MFLDKETKQLISLFNNTFEEQYNVILLSDSDEPDYRPCNSDCATNVINFANGYINSALHEIAHWVIAGESRRKLADYGYWYEEDGRDSQQQMLFQQLEIFPQAVEKAFCEAMSRQFNASIDNLLSPSNSVQRAQFEADIESKKKQLEIEGFPKRAEQFLGVLTKQFN